VSTPNERGHDAPVRRYRLLLAIVLPVLVLATVVGGWTGLLILGVGASIIAAGMIDN
jgi:hypothetical protein